MNLDRYIFGFILQSGGGICPILAKLYSVHFIDVYKVYISIELVIWTRIPYNKYNVIDNR